MNPRRSPLVLAAILPLVAAAPRPGLAAVPPGFAEYTAHFCDSDSTATERTWSRLSNKTSTGPIDVACPVLIQDAGTSNTIASATVRVADLHYVENVSCTLKVFRSELYVATGWFSTKTSSGSDEAVQSLAFGPLGAAIGVHHITMSCTLPPTYDGNKSSLISYTVSINE